ncbi:MAG: hypothetical protein WKF73_00950 [Nocardioidaceae bacterium]
MPAVITLAVGQAARDARGLVAWRTPAGDLPTRAPTSSGSTASAARPRCCRWWPGSSPRSTYRWPRSRFPIEPPTTSPRSSRCGKPSLSLLPDGRPFPTALDPFTCNRYEIADFTVKAQAAGARYLGLCCGAGPHHVRSMAEALGRTPEASRYSVDMSKHAFFGTADGLASHNREYRDRL